jgi:riboflavin biosynthesis pyrimidine reductase
MASLPPLEPLYDVSQDAGIQLPDPISTIYGRFGFPLQSDRPYVISNFVTTLDGVVSLGMKDKTDGDQISGFNEHDTFVMALLRAVCDVVIVGAGSLRKSSQHIWTAEHVYPSLSDEFKQLRRSMGLEQAPLNVFITGSGNVDPGLPIFHTEGVPVAIVTTLHGAEAIKKKRMPKHVEVIAPGGAPFLTVRQMLKSVHGILPHCKLVMMEGGPHILGNFLAEGCIDELFLTLAPQVAGRGGDLNRLGLVADRIFAPEHSVWARLLSLKKSGQHLFLRYAFEA